MSVIGFSTHFQGSGRNNGWSPRKPSHRSPGWACCSSFRKRKYTRRARCTDSCHRNARARKSSQFCGIISHISKIFTTYTHLTTSTKTLGACISDHEGPPRKRQGSYDTWRTSWWAADHWCSTPWVPDAAARAASSKLHGHSSGDQLSVDNRVCERMHVQIAPHQCCSERSKWKDRLREFHHTVDAWKTENICNESSLGKQESICLKHLVQHVDACRGWLFG